MQSSPARQRLVEGARQGVEDGACVSLGVGEVPEGERGGGGVLAGGGWSAGPSACTPLLHLNGKGEILTSASLDIITLMLSWNCLGILKPKLKIRGSIYSSTGHIKEYTGSYIC